jgi:hypothetical protein
MPVAGGPFIQKTGILLEVDAADKTSYSGTGTTWINQITPGTFNGTLNNVAFNSSDANGALVFTGSNTFVDFGNLGSSLTSSFSFQVAFKPAPTASGQPYTILSYASASATSSFTFKLDYTSSNQTVVLTTFSTGSGAVRAVYALSASVASGSWNIVHGTFGPSLAALYINGLGSAYAETTGSVVGYNTSNRLYAGLNFGSTSGYYSGSIANIIINNADLDGLTINKNYNAIASRFSLPKRVPLITDADAFNFIETAGIVDETQQVAINSLVLGLKSTNLWTKMQALYPFVGGNATSHKYNLKDPRNINSAFRILFNGAVTHNNSGVSASLAGYGETNFIPSASFADISSSIHIAIQISTRPVNIDTSFLNFMGDQLPKDYAQPGLTIGYGNGSLRSDAYAYAGGGSSNYASGGTLDGLHVATKTSAVGMTAYRVRASGTNSATGGSTFVKTSANTDTIRLFGAYLNNLSGGVLYQYASIGTGLSATDVSSLYSLITAFNNTLGRS